METKEKFKSNPYNKSNILIKETDIINIMSKLNINNFKINNINNYQEAFIHKSYCKLKDYEEFKNSNNSLQLQDKSYEALEFLGDSLLGSVITNYLYKRYYLIYNQNEGFLTQMKNKLVNGEMLGFLADKLNFNKFMIISEHIDTNCNGRNNYRILEDIFESFIASIYIDTSNFDIVTNFIISTFEKYVDFSVLIITDNNYKDQLLRYLQNNYKIQPTYKFTKENNIFYSTVYKGDEQLSEGKGDTKRKSEQDAAKNTLKTFRLL